MNDPQHAHRDDEGGNALPLALFAGNGANAGRTSIRPPQVLDGDTAWELYRRGEPVFRVGKFVGVLFRQGEEGNGELGVYCPTTRKLALFDAGALTSVALEAGVGEP